ncbi:hypothetical protein CW304_02455 [Bacillus sp. UFRGS-B20]|nr:hypothetical protein CW304_02455 [Bacillus sp. UFRGS-B20]
MPFVYGINEPCSTITNWCLVTLHIRFLKCFKFSGYSLRSNVINIAFVIGGFSNAGWNSYFPMAGTEFTSGVGNNYYANCIQFQSSDANDRY